MNRPEQEADKRSHFSTSTQHSPDHIVAGILPGKQTSRLLGAGNSIVMQVGSSQS